MTSQVIVGQGTVRQETPDALFNGIGTVSTTASLQTCCLQKSRHLPQAACCVHPTVTSHHVQAVYPPLPPLHTVDPAHNPVPPLPVVPVPPPAARLHIPCCHLLLGQGLYPSLCHLLLEERVAPPRITYPCRTACARASATPCHRDRAHLRATPPWGTACEHPAVTSHTPSAG